MNCRECRNPEDAKRNREEALRRLRAKGVWTKESRDQAVDCCECAADMLAKDATRRMEENEK